MAPSSTVLSVVYVLLFLFPVLPAATEEPASVSAQMVLAACKTVGGGSTDVGVLFCEEALGSVAGGIADLDYQVFAGLAVGLLADNTTSTKAKTDRLLRDGGVLKHKAEDDVTVARCLLLCQSLYGGIVDGGPACTASVKARKFGEATAILEKAAAAAKECEDGFGKNNADSPLSAENDDAFKLAKLRVALVKNA